MTSNSIDERTPDHFLLRYDETSPDMGPGTYDIKI